MINQGHLAGKPFSLPGGHCRNRTDLTLFRRSHGVRAKRPTGKYLKSNFPVFLQWWDLPKSSRTLLHIELVHTFKICRNCGVRTQTSTVTGWRTRHYTTASVKRSELLPTNGYYHFNCAAATPHSRAFHCYKVLRYSFWAAGVEERNYFIPAHLTNLIAHYLAPLRF